MDSLTQFALGSIVGCAALKDTSKKTILIGGLVATIPDLDVFLKPFYADGNFVVVHRSFSHSLLCATLLSGILAKLTLKKYSFQRRFLFFFLVLFTHALLDCCTTYGTQLFWPFDRQLISFNNIHVIEPIYTLSLLIPLGIITFFQKENSKKLSIIYLSLLLSTAYLGWTFCSKTMAKKAILTNLQTQAIDYDNVLITPTPFNSFLWKAIIKKDSLYHFGSYSIFDQEAPIRFYKKTHQPQLLNAIANYCDVQTMLRHCDGFPFVEGDEEKINIYAVKFGPANYAGRPIFIMPFQAKKLGTDVYEFQIIDNRFDNKNVKMFNQELWQRIFRP